MSLKKKTLDKKRGSCGACYNYSHTYTVTHLIRINETRRLMAFLDGRLVSFCDGNLLAKLMMSPYEEEKDNEWARNERVNSKITAPHTPHSYLEET